MVSTKMYIPKILTVGYQTRNSKWDSTYTGKLAYIIYTDDKGKLRKEASWQSWCEKKLGRDDIENVPTSGFVLNKGVGGGGSSWSYHSRAEKIRVYDPRDFEFEITTANLLFILQECTSTKGKGLEGEFVYAWSGKDLVLLPVNSAEYTDCTKFTSRQAMKITKNEMVEGHSYLMKDNTTMLYIGHLHFNSPKHRRAFNPVGKRYVFAHEGKIDRWKNTFVGMSGLTKVAEKVSEETSPNFPKLYTKFVKSHEYGFADKVNIRKVKYNSEAYPQKILLVKEDNQYFVAEIDSLNGGVSYGNGYGIRGRALANKYLIRKSNKPFVPEAKGGKVKIPEPVPCNNSYYYGDKDPAYDTGITKRELNNTQFYSVSIVTDKGTSTRI